MPSFNNLVSVVIPTYNRKEKLRRLLTSLNKSTYNPIEIIVVDDASTDGTDKVIREEFPYVKYIRHERETLVWKSRNDGILASEGDIVFMIDDDNIVEPTTIGMIKEAFDKFPDAGVIAPVTCYYSDPEKVMYAGAVFSPFMRRTTYLYTNYPCKSLEGKVLEADGFANSYAFRKDLAIRAGLIPKEIPWNGEDGYLQYKIKKMGYRLLLYGSARVYHDANPNVSRYNEMRLYYALRSKIFFHKTLDDTRHKFTFYLSLPLYVLGYSKTAIDSGIGLKGIKAVLEGFFDGITGNYELKYIKK